MMVYYPKNKVKENQYTSGGEYAFPSGKEYVGYYYTLSNGNVYSGKNPQVASSVLLIPYSEVIYKKNNPKTEFYNQLVKNSEITDIQKYKDIPIYYPILTEKDYTLGSITRYFCNRIDSPPEMIKEISKEVFDALDFRDNTYDYILHTIIKVPWQVSGPVSDVYQNGVLIRPGIVNTNLRQTEIANKTFPGLFNYLKNMLELAKITS